MKIYKGMFVVLGSIMVVLGIIGLLLPVIPTAPFILVAAACYARGSDKFYTRLIRNRWFGRHVRDYREGKGVALKAKILGTGMLWISVTCSAIFITPMLWARVILFTSAISVTIYMIFTKTAKEEEE